MERSGHECDRSAARLRQDAGEASAAASRARAAAAGGRGGSGGHAAPPPVLRIAYLAPEYPKVSHTFVRREIRALEQRGHEVLRLAIRGGATVDAADREESKRTITCLALPRVGMLVAVATAMIARPVAWLRAVTMALRMGRRSDRGLLRHVAYLIEAAVLLRVCAVHGIRHVHVHFGTNAAAVARLMRCLSGRRLAYSMTIHGPDEFDAPRGLSLREKVVDAAFVVAISDYCSAQLRRWADPLDWQKIHVVHCAVAPEFFERAAPIPAASRTLLSVGRLSAQKGQLVLLDALARLLAEGVDVRLVLAGDGEMRGELERAIRTRRLEGHVTITGWVDEPEVRRLLVAARALVQPSFAEGLPVVLMEALAMRRPVIATQVAGVPELVIPGQNGWLVPAGNVDELAAAMRAALAASRERLDGMGRAGARRVRQRHDAGTEAGRLEGLLRESAAGRAVGGPG